MNSFYHNFAVSFNWWFIVLPIMTVFMIFYGTTNLKLNKVSRRIMRRDKKDYLLRFVVVLLDVALHWLILAESTAGIFQMIVNNLSPNDDIFWALVMFIFGMIFSTGFVFLFFFSAAKFGEWLKREYLKKSILGR